MDKVDVYGKDWERYEIPEEIMIEIAQQMFRIDTAHVSDIMHNEMGLELEDYLAHD